MCMAIPTGSTCRMRHRIMKCRGNFAQRCVVVFSTSLCHLTAARLGALQFYSELFSSESDPRRGPETRRYHRWRGACSREGGSWCMCLFSPRTLPSLFTLSQTNSSGHVPVPRARAVPTVEPMLGDMGEEVSPGSNVWPGPQVRIVYVATDKTNCEYNCVGVQRSQGAKNSHANATHAAGAAGPRPSAAAVRPARIATQACQSTGTCCSRRVGAQETCKGG